MYRIERRISVLEILHTKHTRRKFSQKKLSMKYITFKIPILFHILYTPLFIPNSTLLRKSATILFFCSTGVCTGVGVLTFFTATTVCGGGLTWVETLEGGGASNCRLKDISFILHIYCIYNAYH